MTNEVLTFVGEKSGDCVTCLSRVLGRKEQRMVGRSCGAAYFGERKCVCRCTSAWLHKITI